MNNLIFLYIVVITLIFIPIAKVIGKNTADVDCNGTEEILVYECIFKITEKK